jgi:hypothetical protein
MKSVQNIKIRQRKGNLHVDLPEHFTAEMAADLTCLITEVYRGEGNIFVHTAEVLSVAPDSKRIFARCLEESGLPQDNLYVTGSKGLDFSPDNIRVIVYQKKKSGCGGRCKECKCQTN